jgi:hypothetical protein
LSQRNALIARQRRAVATKKVISQSSAAVSAMGEGLNASSELDRMEAKIRLTESEAAAYQEIESESVDAQFRELDYDIDIESALEALKSRRGDCTEYAVLLAAMGRAVGIPTRVVSGLVYSRSFEGENYVFVPHVWVHAWTGAGWESFDAALGSFDSTHLAFATSDDGNPSDLFAGMNLAHDLRLTSAARVAPRKTTAK